jgi:hypothetical protein
MKISFELKVTYEKEGENPYTDRFSDSLEIADKAEGEKLGFDARSFGETLFNLYLLVFAKTEQYGDSWQKRGEIRGPIANIDRKYDRIMRSIEMWTEEGKNDPYPRIDGTADLAVYSILYLSTFLRRHYPAAFERWWKDEMQDFIEHYRSVPEHSELHTDLGFEAV